MITISLCMIVKNEEAVLARALDSIREAVDEIILVDTGSSDRTKEIALQYTSQVFDYPWQQDFASARNFSCSKASMDYWMWLDADDVIPPDSLRQLKELKASLDPATDVVMMKYHTGFDDDGTVTCSYYRERLLKNHRGFLWSGRVHEAVVPAGVIQYLPIAVEHRKTSPKDPDRNLQIYQNMLQKGEPLSPRHQFYYGRELFYHEEYQAAAAVFSEFLHSRQGWLENQIDACRLLAACHGFLNQKSRQLETLFSSFLLDAPRAEICCEIGHIYFEQEHWNQAIFWYRRALECSNTEQNGAFFQPDCHQFLPCLQLCVCYDRLGLHEKALEYHLRAREVRPNAKAVQLNQLYFEQLTD